MELIVETVFILVAAIRRNERASTSEPGASRYVQMERLLRIDLCWVIIVVKITIIIIRVMKTTLSAVGHFNKQM